MPKKVVVAGAGAIGLFLADRLSAEGMDVVLLDQDPEVLRGLQSSMDVAMVTANTTSRSDLKQAAIEDANLFIATTRRDEVNVIACLLAHDLGIPRRIAVTHYLGLPHQQLPQGGLGVDQMVNTNEEVKRELLETLATTQISEEASFGNGQLCMVGHHVLPDSTLVGQSLHLSCGAKKDWIRLGGLVRGHRRIAATENTPLLKDDYVYLITTRSYRRRLRAMLHADPLRTRSALVYGENFLARLLAQALVQERFSVTLLTSNPLKARKAQAEQEHNGFHFQVRVGDGTDPRTLRELGQSDPPPIFVAAGKNDACNLNSCLLARGLGFAKTILIVKSGDLAQLALQAGVDVNITPSVATAKGVQHLVHEHRVEEYRASTQSNLEVVELLAREGSRITHTHLGGLRLPQDTVIGGISNAREARLADTKSRIRPGDKALVITSPEHLSEIEDWFQAA